MQDDDITAQASASGILGCLRLLADEAASLGLDESSLAIWEAVGIAERESGARATPAIRIAGEGIVSGTLH